MKHKLFFRQCTDTKPHNKQNVIRKELTVNIISMVRNTTFYVDLAHRFGMELRTRLMVLLDLKKRTFCRIRMVALSPSVSILQLRKRNVLRNTVILLRRVNLARFIRARKATTARKSAIARKNRQRKDTTAVRSVE